MNRHSFSTVLTKNRTRSKDLGAVAKEHDHLFILLRLFMLFPMIELSLLFFDSKAFSDWYCPLSLLQNGPFAKALVLSETFILQEAPLV